MTSKDKPIIAISGSSGFIGRALVAFLEDNHFHVIKLKRSSKIQGANEILWDPYNNQIKHSEIDGLHALISLGGENIAARRWTTSFKRTLSDSRVIPTKFLNETISKLHSPPRVWINASAIGFYGNRGDEVLNEDSSVGEGFLASLVKEWEDASKLPDTTKTRVVNPRFGLVLGKNGGALSKMILPFSLGLGAILGDGKNYMSWIGMNDLLSAILHILEDESLSGPINFTTPNPVTNREFSKTLASFLKRPCFLKAPASILRIILGEMADQALLSSQKVVPQKLLNSGFQFQHPNLIQALQVIK